MAGVQADGVAVALQALVEVLIGEVLVAGQGVGVGEAGLQLQGPLEELERILMLL